MKGLSKHLPVSITALITSEKPQLRRLNAQDGIGCAQIHSASFAHGWSGEDLEQMLIEPSVLGHGAFWNDIVDPIGFLISRSSGAEAEVLTLATASYARRRGIAAQLLAEHLAHLPLSGVRELFLEVDADNQAARALYAQFAFAQVGRRSAYYRRADGSKGEALVLRKTL